MEPAAFATVDIDSEDDAPTIALPVFGESMAANQFIAKGVRFELPRSEWKRIGDQVLADEIALALTFGIARAADEMLLSAVAAATLSEFTLAKAATRGLRFGELAALVGRDGAGAEVSQGGSLHVAGVGAELTPDVAGTYVGAWGRAGVVLREEVAVTVERITKNGQLAVTAWIAGRPLVPDASCFWTVGA